MYLSPRIRDDAFASPRYVMRHRDVILHCRYSTVDNLLRTVITSIIVGIYDCPVCLRYSLHSLTLLWQAGLMFIPCNFARFSIFKSTRFDIFFHLLCGFCVRRRGRSWLRVSIWWFPERRQLGATPCNLLTTPLACFFMRHKWNANAIEMMLKSTSTRSWQNFLGFSKKRMKKGKCRWFAALNHAPEED